MKNKHRFHGKMTRDKNQDFLNYEEAVAAIVFHATNLTRDNTSTIITHQRIQSIRSLLDLLQSYNEELDILEEQAFLEV